MKKYKILWSSDQYGSIIISANTEDEARDMFDTGEFNQEDLNYKGGSMICEKIEEINE